MIAWITGTIASFGAEIARTFTKNAHQVIATGRRKDQLDQLAVEFGALDDSHITGPYQHQSDRNNAELPRLCRDEHQAQLTSTSVLPRREGATQSA